MKVTALICLMCGATPLASAWAFPFQTANQGAPNKPSLGDDSSSVSRRQVFQQIGAAATVAAAFPMTASAIPMVTAEEFETILRDSARSIARVEFSGPKNDVVTVVLSDSTRFGISGIIESSVDPRSPLKIAALCRENGVPTKFVDLEALLSTTPKRKMYSNTRVQEAAAKEREKAARIAKDEEDRLAALAKMEQEEAAQAAAGK